MADSAEVIDRISPTSRPNTRPIGYQQWSDLLFVHWRILVADLQKLVPKRLTIDTYDEHAWVGLVLFHMSGVRPAWSPAVPGVSAFHETNLRTYVHLDGQNPGVWFFSLEAASSLAVRIARWKWHLPYYRASMQLKREGNRVHYQSERLWPGEIGPGVNIDSEFGEPLPVFDQEYPSGQAVPGTFEHFLAERYILYSENREGQLYSGRVHHKPYPLRNAKTTQFRESLLKAANISPHGDVQHVMFSEGVEVEIHPLRPI